MSNRGRQNVASYFAKELELDWRIGAAYFESLLIDYDVHSNYGNWMYVAGVGNDPRDRKFNVQLQAERYDENKSKIVAEYGEELYRAFRLYLYAGCHAFRANRLQAYHIIAERREAPGARPGALRRAYHFLRSLV